MTALLYRPGPPLDAFVALLWHYEDGPPVAHEKERLLPDGSMELVISLRTERVRIYDRDDAERYRTFGPSVVCGAHSSYFVIDTEGQEAVLGAHFKPGGAVPFIGLPADELRDAHVSLDDLWGSRAVELRDRLLEAPSPRARLRILEAALLERAAGRLARHPAVAYALGELAGSPHTARIAEVASAAGLSPRGFIGAFSREVGLTPKLFCRVLRFQEVIRRAHAGPVAWVDVAAACGYFDQAHFIRDFKAFAGVSPSAYLAHRTDHVNHVPLVV
jgi:AraC-like DNA-binding protein